MDAAFTQYPSLDVVDRRPLPTLLVLPRRASVEYLTRSKIPAPCSFICRCFIPKYMANDKPSVIYAIEQCQEIRINGQFAEPLPDEAGVQKLFDKA